jgi:hypothetical protein
MLCFVSTRKQPRKSGAVGISTSAVLLIYF